MNENCSPSNCEVISWNMDKLCRYTCNKDGCADDITLEKSKEAYWKDVTGKCLFYNSLRVKFFLGLFLYVCSFNEKLSGEKEYLIS